MVKTTTATRERKTLRCFGLQLGVDKHDPIHRVPEKPPPRKLEMTILLIDRFADEEIAMVMPMKVSSI